MGRSGGVGAEPEDRASGPSEVDEIHVDGDHAPEHRLIRVGHYTCHLTLKILRVIQHICAVPIQIGNCVSKEILVRLGPSKGIFPLRFLPLERVM